MLPQESSKQECLGWKWKAQGSLRTGSSQMRQGSKLSRFIFKVCGKTQENTLWKLLDNTTPNRAKAFIHHTALHKNNHTMDFQIKGVSAVGWWCLFCSWHIFSCSAVKVPRRFSIQESASKMSIERWSTVGTHSVTSNEMRACQPAAKATDLLKDWNLLMKGFVESSAHSTIV